MPQVDFSEVRRRYSSDGGTAHGVYLYAHEHSTRPDPPVGWVLLRRQVNGGAWANVTQALYTYYGSGEPYGNLNDLKTVQSQTWSGAAWVSTGTAIAVQHAGRGELS